MSGLSNPIPAQAGAPTAGCPGQCPGNFGRSLRLHSLSSARASAQLLRSSPSEIKQAEVFYVTLIK